MTSLEDYLLSDYLVHRQDMASLTWNISEAVTMLLQSNDNKGWPYQCTSSDSGIRDGEISHGTMAMVLTALGRASGFCSTTSGTFSRLVNNEKADTLVVDSLKVLASDLASLSSSKQMVPISKTFGDGNPLTVSHLVDLLASLKPDRTLAKLADSQLQSLKTSLDQISSAISDAAGSIEKTIQKGFSGSQEDILTPSDSSYYKNAFVPMRTVRAAVGLGEISKIENIRKILPNLRSFFEVTLHEQLSFSAIPDSRFDAAELVFSLEGLVLCAKEAVDSTLFRRVLEVLEEKQNTSAHWRPSKPFLAAPTGAIFLPLSVEVANSLMRSIALMDEGRTHDTYTSKGIPLLKRFWNWLQARAVRLQLKAVDCIGWHSEHINAPHLVHPWDTSLVIEFMIGYHELLEREIQSTTLTLSGLQCAPPKPRDRQNVIGEWEKVIDKMDPSIGGEEDHQVYRRIGKEFVAGWALGKPENYSMMLYGPPGTGKTSVADNLCEQLGMPLITVTVSDFLGSGGANVESRAKAIFQTLEHQQDAVILFDEIDSFLLDRDSKFYSDQDSLFQFLTPGMLTKFNNLRKVKKCIFIIATNYDNRIDPAIKRTGRVDKRYLLPLPDSERRKRILVDNGLPSDGYSDELRKISVLFGYGDLVNAAKAGKGDSGKIVALLSGAPRATSFNSYLKRRKEYKPDFPAEEFEDLIRLSNDAGGCAELEELQDNKQWKSLPQEIQNRVGSK